jgi:HK97 gp10 family phage protein
VSFKHSPNAEISASLSSSDQILKKLKELNEKIQKKSAAAAARAGMRVVRKAAVRNAQAIDDPDSPRSIAKNITVQNSPRQGRRAGGIVMRVGVRGGAKQYANTRENMRKQRVGKSYKTLGDATNPGGDTWYWRFIEFGTARQRARPFLQKALADNAGIVTNVVIQKLQKDIFK